jgi:mono/diheme cytochrome c family protein
MHNKYGWLVAGVPYLALATMILLAAGCSTTTGKNVSTDAEPTGNGPKLWADNCIRCHNIRSPNMYNDAQWEVVSMHMRVRANLTAIDTREVLAFLKSAH